MPQIGGLSLPDFGTPGGGASSTSGGFQPIATQPPQVTPGTAPAQPAGGHPTLWQVFTQAAQATNRELRFGLPAAYYAATGNQEAANQETEALKSYAPPTATPASISDVLSGKVGVVRAAAENVASMLPMLPAAVAGGAAATAGGAALGLGALGAGVAGLAGAGLANAPYFTGANVERVVDEKGQLDPDAARRSIVAGLGQGAVQGAIDRIIPGAGKLVGGAAMDVAGGLVSRVIKGGVEGAATASLGMAAQAAGSRYAAGLDLTSPDALKEYVTAGGTGGLVGSFMGGFSGMGMRHADPAQLANDPDALRQVVDNALNPQQPPLALPAPETFGRSSIPHLLTPQGPDAVVDSTGRAVTADQTSRPLDQAAVILSNASREGAPTLDLGTVPNANLDQATPEVLAALRGEPAPFQAPNVLADQGKPFEPPAPVNNLVDVTTNARPFVDQPIEDLHTVISRAEGGAALDPGLVDAARSELAARQAEVQGAAPLPTGVDFQSRIDELKKGAANNFTKSLTADTPQDLLGRVYNQIFTEQDERPTTAKFAQRVGLLDDKLQPTDLANRIEAQKAAGVADADLKLAPEQAAPAPTAESGPVDHEFIQNWQNGLTDKSDASIKALQPTNPTDLANKVYDALGQKDFTPQMEKLAQDIGLLNDKKELTVEGRKAALRAPDATPVVDDAAKAQGYEGPTADAFKAGVAEHTGTEPQQNFGSLDEMSAYAAGKVWAEHATARADTATSEQTRSFTKEQLASDKNGRHEYVTSIDVPPDQVRQRAQNNVIDQANLASAKDSNVATLRRMVKQGISDSDLHDAIARARAGEDLFQQPIAEPAQAFIGTKVERGQPRLENARASDVVETPTKAGARAETKEATKSFLLKQELRAAFNSGDITRGEFMRANQAVLQGRHADAVKLLPGHGDASPRLNMQGQLADHKLEQAIDGKTAPEVLDHLAKIAPTPIDAAIMRAVKGMADKLARMGLPINFQVAHTGDAIPEVLSRPGARGVSILHAEPRNTSVFVKGADFGTQTGMNYETVAHEMVHAVTSAVVVDANDERFKNTPIGKAVGELHNIADQVIDHYNKRLENPDEMTPFERSIYHGDVNALNDPREVIAWGLTNPDMQDYLESIPYSPKQSLWGKFVDTVRNLLGIPANATNALDALLHTSEALLNSDERDLRPILTRNSPNGGVLANAQIDARDINAATRTAPASNKATEAISQGVSGALDRIPVRTLKSRMRDGVIYLMSRDGIGRMWAREFPEWNLWAKAHTDRGAFIQRGWQVGDGWVQRFDQIDKNFPKVGVQLRKLMDYTRFDVDPTKTWEQHTWLKPKEGETNPRKLADAARSERLVKEANNLWNTVRRFTTDGQNVGLEHAQAYLDARAMNESSNLGTLAANLHDLVSTSDELKAAIHSTNPMDTYRLAQGLTTATAERDFWRAQLASQVKDAQDYVAAQRGTLHGADKRATDAANLRLSPIESQLAMIKQSLARMEQGPYFHLGRTGDHFVAFQIAKNAFGQADEAKTAKVAELMEKAGFTNAQISTDNTNPNVFVRLPTIEARERLAELARTMQAKELLSEKEIIAAPRDLPTLGTQDRMPAHLQNMMDAIRDSAAFKTDDSMSTADKTAITRQRDAAVAAVREAWVDQQPDNGLSKILTARSEVQGNDPDMVSNLLQAHRSRVVGMANIGSRSKFSDAFAAMAAAHNDAKQVKSPRHEDVDLIHKLRSEALIRDAKTPVNPAAGFWAKARSFGHAYFLGLSPAYSMLELSQLPIMTWPELAKKYGYAKSSRAVYTGGRQALEIMRAVASEASKVGWSRMADVAITDDVLKAAKVPEPVRQFAHRLIGEGVIDIGAAARENGRINDPTISHKLDRTLRWMSATSLYAETFTRLSTALAARELHGNNSEEAVAYAKQAIANSTFNMSSDNTARALGRKGFAGEFTPVMTQFMQFTAQLTEKLAYEVHTMLLDREATKQDKLEASRWLIGHMTATTALAGTLGLPFASAAAAAVEKLLIATGAENKDWDATAAWRNFLASVFGKDVGEVLSRGATRPLGFDMSGRVGEGDLLPFTGLLVDKRSWKDASDDYTSRMAGAVPNAVMQMFASGDKFARGDILGGMHDVVPVAFKGPVAAYKMTQDGYVDSKNNPLPMTAGARDIMWQLLGVTPEDKAEYNEAKADQSEREDVLTRQVANIRGGFIRSMLGRDHASAAQYIQQAQAFDQEHPTMAILPGLGGALQAAAQNRILPSALGAPAGVKARDIEGQALTRYADINYTQGGAAP